MASSMTVYGESVVVSAASTTAPNFIPMTHWIRASEVLKARATLEMRGQANSCQINGAFQTSNDQISVNTPTSIISGGNYLTMENFQYQSAFTDISSSTAGVVWIRFGLQCLSGNSAVAGCWAAITVDIQGA